MMLGCLAWMLGFIWNLKIIRTFSSEFLVSDDIDKEIKKYLHEKTCSSGIGDIVVNILANSTSTEAHIYIRIKKTGSSKQISSSHEDLL